MVSVATKDWSLGEWLANFLQDDGVYYDDVVYDDIYDDTMPGGDAPHFGDEDDEGYLDSMIIMGLAACLAFFVYYRRQREQAEARRQREQQQKGGQNGAPAPVAQNNEGFFPPAGDPNFAPWAAGGVGH